MAQTNLAEDYFFGIILFFSLYLGLACTLGWEKSRKAILPLAVV